MIVCICHRVSDRIIRDAAQQGASFEELQAMHGVATRCGRCESCARALWSSSRGGGPMTCPPMQAHHPPFAMPC
ncbi:(2Fe-2S)-binding protein [Tepidimonas taiwanensis]|uniref:(2Fe-2S)-binding protein n=1 Tax=Tepidimonas taiwanensis TaxID=307486 RepID=UPI0009EB3236